MSLLVICDFAGMLVLLSSSMFTRDSVAMFVLSFLRLLLLADVVPGRTSGDDFSVTRLLASGSCAQW